MIRLLTPDDLPAAIEVADSRNTFQTLQLDEPTRVGFRKYVLDNRLSGPSNYFFFGYFDDETGELKAWASSNTMPNWEYNIGVSFSKPGLPRMVGTRKFLVAQALNDLRDFITDYWREHHFLVCWNARPNKPNYLEPGPIKLSDPSEYQREAFCILPAGSRMEDETLHIGVMGGGTIPVEQAIQKFTDLKPVAPHPLATHFNTHPLWVPPTSIYEPPPLS